MWQCPLGLVLVERKTWKDFVDSVTGTSGSDGGNRLVGQLIDGPKSTAIKVLFMEGLLPPYLQSGGRTIAAEDMDDMSVSLQWQFGCLFVHSLNHEHTPTRLARLYTYTQKDEHSSLIRPMAPVPQEKIYINPEFRRKIAMLMCVPGLGEKGGLTIAQNSPSPRDAANLTAADIMKIEGMGKQRAQNWEKFWSTW